jgi:hypothetical protein
MLSVVYCIVLFGKVSGLRQGRIDIYFRLLIRANTKER